MPKPNLAEFKIADFEVIEELLVRDSDGDPLFHKLYAFFQEESPQLLDQLDKAMQAKEQELAYDAIHQMKGSAAAMGAKRLHKLCEALIKMCSDGSLFVENWVLEAIIDENASYQFEINEKIEDL